MADPVHQFEIHKIFTLGPYRQPGNRLHQFVGLHARRPWLIISLLMIGGSAGRRLIPSRFQSLAELSYEFVGNTLRSSVGRRRHEILSRSCFRCSCSS